MKRCVKTSKASIDFSVIKQELMQVNINNLVSISEANQNFSKVARMVDENGAAVILKNNTPRYILIDYSKFQQDTIADNATVEEAANNILNKHLKAFEELAK
ncbi:type II toxin-antitoxin system Phd/YefM family antitoxin [Clostridium sp. 19966]|uniref:type II toxin-antitoxin system Phd/YefM family antitoxin n=1 Tax=Clostridium sp. 19966 TaxID=2768166 RepID=UPI0028E27FEF|nr:type II toxin-antitoxin system Phd/YefM family antitoxin [Clostridium sp. 19966]